MSRICEVWSKIICADQAAYGAAAADKISHRSQRFTSFQRFQYRRNFPTSALSSGEFAIIRCAVFPLLALPARLQIAIKLSCWFVS